MVVRCNVVSCFWKVAFETHSAFSTKHETHVYIMICRQMKIKSVKKTHGWRKQLACKWIGSILLGTNAFTFPWEHT